MAQDGSDRWPRAFYIRESRAGGVSPHFAGGCGDSTSLLLNDLFLPADRYQPQGVLMLPLAAGSTMGFALPRADAAERLKPCRTLDHRFVFFARLLTVSSLKPCQFDMKRYNQMAMVEASSEIKKNVTSISIFLSPQHSQVPLARLAIHERPYGQPQASFLGDHVSAGNLQALSLSGFHGPETVKSHQSLVICQAGCRPLKHILM